MDRWAERFSGGRLHKVIAVASLPVVLGTIFLAAAVGRLREGEGVALALVGAGLVIGGPLLAVRNHKRSHGG